MMDAVYNRNTEQWDGSDAQELRYQIGRIGGLKCFPREVVAVRELIRVLAICDDIAHVVRVIDELAESALECPVPARLRAMIYEKRAKVTRARCYACAGEGFRSVPLLVTYRGGYTVESQQPMPELSWEEAEDFAAKLLPKQALLSCAVACWCRGGVPPQSEVRE